MHEVFSGMQLQNNYTYNFNPIKDGKERIRKIRYGFNRKCYQGKDDQELNKNIKNMET